MIRFLVVELEDGFPVEISGFASLAKAEVRANRVYNDQADAIAAEIEKGNSDPDLEVVVWDMKKQKVVYDPEDIPDCSADDPY